MPLQVQAAAAGGHEQQPDEDAERDRPALRERPHDDRQTDHDHRRRQDQGDDPHTRLAFIVARRLARVGSGADSMITRHGRSASTVSSVLPNSDAPSTRRGSGITIAAARMSAASSTIRRPAWPARIFSTWPDTRLPPWILPCSITESAPASASLIVASIGSAFGTVTSASTWIPRRRRLASRLAVAITRSS